MHLDTRLLTSFLAVADELNFSRAAQQLHMSQQALSAQVQRLELAVGVSLFLRTTRYVRLTPAGEALVPFAQTMLKETDKAEQALRAASDPGVNPLRVGFSIGGALDLTAPILGELAERRPDIAVELRETALTDPSAGLRSGGVDAAFVRLPFTDDDLDHLDLMHDPRVLMVHRSHVLAARQSIRFADIADLPLLVTRTQDPRWDEFWLAADVRDSEPPISHEVSTLDEEMLLVATRGAISISVATAARWPHPPEIAFIPIEDLSPSVIALAWPRGTRNPLVPELVAAARAVRERRPSLDAAPDVH